MNEKSKILFTDLDDTLLNRKKQITPENALAIEEALDRGHKIVINTGRPLGGTLEQIQHLRLNRNGCYAVAYNGGLIYDCYTKEIIYKKSIPLPYVRYIFQQTRQAGIHCQTYNNNYLLAEKDSPFLQFYVAKTHMKYQIDPDLTEHLTEEPIKVLAIHDDCPEKLHIYRSSMENWAKGKISLFFSSNTYLEHVAEGVSKGAAMKILCQKLHVPIVNTIGAGDAENDITMLQTAHIGVAMKNAAPQVKSAAGYITENDCDHSGLAEIIKKFLLT